MKRFLILLTIVLAFRGLNAQTHDSVNIYVRETTKLLLTAKYTRSLELIIENKTDSTVEIENINQYISLWAVSNISTLKVVSEVFPSTCFSITAPAFDKSFWRKIKRDRDKIVKKQNTNFSNNISIPSDDYISLPLILDINPLQYFFTNEYYMISFELSLSGKTYQSNKIVLKK